MPKRFVFPSKKIYFFETFGICWEVYLFWVWPNTFFSLLRARVKIKTSGTMFSRQTFQKNLFWYSNTKEGSTGRHDDDFVMILKIFSITTSN